MRKPGPESIITVAAGAALVGLHYAIFADFLPTASGKLGHDYGHFLPRMLDGYFWYANNGLLSVPWHTPSFCGGLPQFPSAQALYFSAPQFFTFLVNPVAGIRLTLLLFAALGCGGFYLLARRIFQLSRPVALLGATLFLFNTLFTSRMMVGHITFHAFMTAPLIFFFLQRPVDGTLRSGRLPPGWRFALDLVCVAMLVAYMANTSIAHALFPTLTAAIAVAALQYVALPGTLSLWYYTSKFALAGLLALSLCAAKLVAIQAYISLFPRDLYRVPGIPSLATLLEVSFRTLFGSPPDGLARDALVNAAVTFSRQEFEYGVTIVPLLILAAGAVLGPISGAWKNAAANLQPAQWIALLVFAVILSVPIALNYYSPGWNALLKEIPLVGSSVMLFRWFSILIPGVILLSIVTLDRTPWLRDHRTAIGAAAIVGALAIHATTDRSYYRDQPYDPAPIVEAWRTTRLGESTPTISHIAAHRGTRGHPIRTLTDDSSLATGGSSLFCYEPLFGYKLERYPQGSLRPGPIRSASTGEFNLKNPSCYVYPEQNACAPGDHFRQDQVEQVETFVRYRGIDFAMPLRQRLANWLSLATLTGILAFWIGLAGVSLRGRRTRTR